MADLDARQLRYFVTVAEELNFGRAAQRLGMTQPPLSRAIRDLERQLGVALFERSTHHVELTRAGSVLLHDAQRALDLMSAAARRAQHAGQTVPTLRVALKADYDGGLLPQILDAYQREAAAVPVDVLLGGRGEQAPALRAGLADVALLPAPFDETGLDTELLLTEPRLVALPAGDPLTQRPTLRLADLDRKLLPDGTPARTGGVPAPETPPPRLDLAQVFNLIELGNVTIFVPVSLARRHARPEIVYREVENLDPFRLMVAWPQTARSAAVAAFVLAASAVAAGTRERVSVREYGSR